MKIQKLLALAVFSLFAVQISAETITCTLTSGSSILNRKGEKGLLKKNGAYLKAVPTTAAGWNGVTVTKIKNDNPLYDKAVLLTYQHTNSGGFLGFGGDNGCKCANKDIPAALKKVCENSSQGRVLALGKQTRSVAKKATPAIKAAEEKIAKQIAATQQEIEKIEDESSHTAADEAELEALESDETSEENAMIEEDDAAAGDVQDPVDLCVEQKQQAMRTSMQNAKKNRKSNDEIEEAIAAATEKMTERCQNQQ